MLAAVALPPDSVAATAAWSPTFIEPMPSRLASTIVVLVTTYVFVMPSALFSVIDVLLTAVTWPRWESMVSYPPPDFGTTNWP